MYKKCGIVLSGIVPQSQQQFSLLEDDNQSSQATQSKELIHIVGGINSMFGKGVIRLGTETLSDQWQMTRNLMSNRYTTHWSELLRVD